MSDSSHAFSIHRIKFADHMKGILFLTTIFLSVFADAQDTVSYKFFEVISGEKVVICRRPGYVSESAVMITNGGMFDPDYSPHGLLICDGKLYKKLDLRTAKGANFYLQPNGVFYIDQTGYHIATSRAFSALYPDLDKKKPDCATQSGPMLVISDSVNTVFDKASQNTNVRSGVGILPNGYPVFVIASGITFYDFAMIFKEKFHCRQALFLDGAISKMCVGQQLNDSDFGPMIEVLKN
jgi:uncharacterized protein YigE (DUF2233 family)